jgi:hypothetical protein
MYSKQTIFVPGLKEIYFCQFIILVPLGANNCGHHAAIFIVPLILISSPLISRTAAKKAVCSTHFAHLLYSFSLF